MHATPDVAWREPFAPRPAPALRVSSGPRLARWRGVAFYARLGARWRQMARARESSPPDPKNEKSGKKTKILLTKVHVWPSNFASASTSEVRQQNFLFHSCNVMQEAFKFLTRLWRRLPPSTPRSVAWRELLATPHARPGVGVNFSPRHKNLAWRELLATPWRQIRMPVQR